MKTGTLVVLLAGMATFFGCAAEAAEQEEVGTSNDAIIGGTLETGHAYVVALGGDTRASCTGTVISRRSVLTAAHCLGSPVKKIYLGNTVLGGARTIAVTKAVRHPGYATTGGKPTNDLAVLQLAEDAPVQAAPLFRDNLENTSEFIGPKFTFVGYGDNQVASSPWGGTGGFGTKRITQFAIKAVGPATVGGTPGTIDATMFYYNVPGLSMCHGDSGGPAFFVQDGVEHVAGVTSFGNPRCSSDGVQQRSDAPQIAAFIQAQIDANENNGVCRSDGTCNESCNTGGEVGDPDCAAAHCAADGICSSACVSDPDCSATEH